MRTSLLVEGYRLYQVTLRIAENMAYFVVVNLKRTTAVQVFCGDTAAVPPTTALEPMPCAKRPVRWHGHTHASVKSLGYLWSGIISVTELVQAYDRNQGGINSDLPLGQVVLKIESKQAVIRSLSKPQNAVLFENICDAVIPHHTSVGWHVLALPTPTHFVDAFSIQH